MTDGAEPRRPRVFAVDDPRLVKAPEAEPAAAARASDAPPEAGRRPAPKIALPTAAGATQGLKLGAIFVSAMVALATLAATVSFFRFVSIALERDDWIGWTATGLLGVAALSGLVLLGRELMGLFRLSRLSALRRDLDGALASRDSGAEREGLARLKALYGGRADMRWPLGRFAEHEGDVHDAGGLLRLADRELMAPLDGEARKLVLRSAKRVSTVTALSPMALIAIAFVLVENVGLLRRLATLYGGRPGVLGSLRLARLVVAHIAGTGGAAMTDDLLGQFFGQDIIRRLSRRLGEGVFNGALTVRLGAAAIDLIRPLPFIEAPPIRARDIVKELLAAEEAAVPDPPRAGKS